MVGTMKDEFVTDCNGFLSWAVFFSCAGRSRLSEEGNAASSRYTPRCATVQQA